MKIVCESFSARRRIISASVAVSCTDALQGKLDKTLLAGWPVDFWNSHRSLTAVPQLHGTGGGGRRLMLRFVECS